jgi:serine/threonine protein kinase
MTFGPADGDSLLGRVLDSKYRVDRMLGRGGFGSVYLATHLMLDHPCAIKVLHRSVLADSMAVARFQQEARATVKIRHPNAISVMDFGITQDSIVYFVMEYFPGTSLREILHRTGPMPLARVAYVLDCVAGALTNAHAQGILHRDVKPDNIMIARKPDGADEVKVVDFGIAKLLDAPGAQPLTLAGTILGTPYYLSPEQVNGFDLDARSDLYALGVVTYEMLTGAVPFSAPTPIAVAMKHVSEQPPTLSGRVAGMTQQVESALMRALAKRPEDRYPSTTAFAQAFSAAVRASTVEPAYPSRVPPAPLRGTSQLEYPDTPQPQGYSTDSRPSGMPTVASTDLLPTPRTPIPAPPPNPSTTAIPWQQEMTVPLQTPVPTPQPIPHRNVTPPLPAPSSQPSPSQGPLHHLTQPESSAPPSRPAAQPAQTPPEHTRSSPIAMIAITVAILGILAAGALAVAVYWTRVRPGDPVPATQPSATSTPEPSSTSGPAVVPLIQIAVNVYDSNGAKRTVVPVAGTVELTQGEQFVQFDLSPRVSGFVYVVDDAEGELKTQLTALPSSGDNIRSNEIVAKRQVLFPGTGKAIAVPKARRFSIVYSSVPLASPALFSGPSKRLLTPDEAVQWREFSAGAHRSVLDTQPNQKSAVVTGPGSGRATVVEIAFTTK